LNRCYPFPSLFIYGILLHLGPVPMVGTRGSEYYCFFRRASPTSSPYMQVFCRRRSNFSWTTREAFTFLGRFLPASFIEQSPPIPKHFLIAPLMQFYPLSQTDFSSARLGNPPLPPFSGYFYASFCKPTKKVRFFKLSPDAPRNSPFLSLSGCSCGTPDSLAFRFFKAGFKRGK